MFATLYPGEPCVCFLSAYFRAVALAVSNLIVRAAELQLLPHKTTVSTGFICRTRRFSTFVPYTHYWQGILRPTRGTSSSPAVCKSELMDSLTVAAFEERATAAEARLAALENKLLEASLAGLTDAQILELQGLKGLLLKVRGEALKVEEERDNAVKAEAALLEENLKLKYRIEILKAAVREGDEKLKKASRS